MLGREIRKALKQNHRVYGTALTGYNQPIWPRLFAQLGLDFVFIDSEHTPVNRETLAWACEAYAAHSVAPFLRIPESSPTQAAMALDAGAQGVIIPYIETVEQVKALVGAVKYRPLKGAALNDVLENHQFPSDETAPYLEDFSPDAVLTIMIESPAGVENLDAMLSIGGVDVVLIGPHDFSVSHGIPEQYDHPLFEEQTQRVIQTCHKYNVGVGIHYISGSLERALEWVQWGCNFISHRADTLFIVDGIQREIQYLRNQLDPDKHFTSLTHDAKSEGVV